MSLRPAYLARWWWGTPLVSAQKQADLCEFKVSQVYKVSSRTTSYTEKPCRERQNTKHKKGKPTLTRLAHKYSQHKPTIQMSGNW